MISFGYLDADSVRFCYNLDNSLCLNDICSNGYSAGSSDVHDCWWLIREGHAVLGQVAIKISRTQDKSPQANSSLVRRCSSTLLTSWGYVSAAVRNMIKFLVIQWPFWRVMTFLGKPINRDDISQNDFSEVAIILQARYVLRATYISLSQSRLLSGLKR